MTDIVKMGNASLYYLNLQETFTQKEYCVCYDSYYGEFCQYKFSPIKLTEDLLLFSKLWLIKAPQNELDTANATIRCKNCEGVIIYDRM